MVAQTQTRPSLPQTDASPLTLAQGIQAPISQLITVVRFGAKTTTIVKRATSMGVRVHLKRIATPAEINLAAQSLDWLRFCRAMRVNPDAMLALESGVIVARRQDYLTPAGRRYSYTASWQRMDGSVTSDACPDDRLPSEWIAEVEDAKLADLFGAQLPF